MFLPEKNSWDLRMPVSMMATYQPLPVKPQLQAVDALDGDPGALGEGRETLQQLRAVEAFGLVEKGQDDDGEQVYIRTG